MVNNNSAVLFLFVREKAYASLGVVSRENYRPNRSAVARLSILTSYGVVCRLSCYCSKNNRWSHTVERECPHTYWTKPLPFKMNIRATADIFGRQFSPATTPEFFIEVPLCSCDPSTCPARWMWILVVPWLVRVPQNVEVSTPVE